MSGGAAALPCLHQIEHLLDVRLVVVDMQPEAQHAAAHREMDVVVAEMVIERIGFGIA